MNLKRDWWRILLGLFVVWLLFFMDLEGRSFASHMLRIANTPETHELGDAIGDKFATLFRGISRRIEYVYHDYYDDGYDNYRHSHR